MLNSEESGRIFGAVYKFSHSPEVHDKLKSLNALTSQLLAVVINSFPDDLLLLLIFYLSKEELEPFNLCASLQ